MIPCGAPCGAQDRPGAASRHTVSKVNVRGISIGELRRVAEQAERLRSREGVPVRGQRVYGSGRNPRPAGEALTTGDVYNEIVLPRLTSQRRSYVDSVAVSGPANVYVIHAWDTAFDETLDAIESAELPADTTYYAIDVLTDRPPSGTAWQLRGAAWLAGEFRQRIAFVGQSLLVLSPWERARALTRSWCLYELLCTATTDSDLIVQVPRDQRASLDAALVRDFAAVVKSFSDLDFEASESKVRTDRDNIMDAVKRVGGVNRANVRVVGALRHWLAESGRQALGIAAAAPAARNGAGWLAAMRIPSLREWLPGPDRGVGAGGISDRGGAERLGGAGVAVVGSSVGNGGAPGEDRYAPRPLVPTVDMEQAQRSALAGREQALGADHPGTLVTVNNLALMLQSLGRHADAEPLMRRALVGKERALGPDHPETLTVAAALAASLEFIGKFDEAERLHHRAVSGFEAALGPDHATVLASMHGLASVLLRNQKADEAHRLARRALSAREQVLGENNPTTLASVDLFARTHDAKGNLAEAEALHRRALRGREKELGAPHPDALASANNLALTLSKRGKLPAADKLLVRALNGRIDAFGHRSPETLASLNNLALVRHKRGRYEQAEQLYRRALAGREAVLGSEHPDTLVTCHNLATVLRAFGDYAEAEQLYRRALAGTIIAAPTTPAAAAAADAAPVAAAAASVPATTVVGTLVAATAGAFGKRAASGAAAAAAAGGAPAAPGERWHSLDALTSLANVLKDTGKVDEAVLLYRQALTGYEKKRGADDPSTLTTMNNLAVALDAAGKTDEAEKLLRKVVSARERVLGETHASTLNSTQNLAGVLKRRGRLEEAEKLLRRVVMARERDGRRATAPATLQSQVQLAVVLEARGNLAGAEALYRKAVVGKLKTLGPNHAETRAIAASLARVLDAMGRTKEAQAVRHGGYRGRGGSRVNGRPGADATTASAPQMPPPPASINKMGHSFESDAVLGVVKSGRGKRAQSKLATARAD